MINIKENIKDYTHVLGIETRTIFGIVVALTFISSVSTALVAGNIFNLPIYPDRYRTEISYATKIDNQYLQVKNDIISLYNRELKQGITQNQPVDKYDFISKTKSLIDFNIRPFNNIVDNIPTSPLIHNSDVVIAYKDLRIDNLKDFQLKLAAKIQKVNNIINDNQVVFDQVKLEQANEQNNNLKQDRKENIVKICAMRGIKKTNTALLLAVFLIFYSIIAFLIFPLFNYLIIKFSSK